MARKKKGIVRCDRRHVDFAIEETAEDVEMEVKDIREG